MKERLMLKEEALDAIHSELLRAGKVDIRITRGPSQQEISSRLGTGRSDREAEGDQAEDCPAQSPAASEQERLDARSGEGAERCGCCIGCQIEDRDVVQYLCCVCMEDGTGDPCKILAYCPPEADYVAAPHICPFGFEPKFYLEK